ncbi:Sec-independent protein translocase subunit TatA [Mangrovibacter yixingensis]|uniref:Sec-independent protein translocase subunit TatA n=1 Tax=Mangrovibacter yixingensis TaxID=1529639 RepID=UPI001CFDB1E9|nr:Sec-independent protein translocase subunit TatA [Mangrovibacter yixingensis]
MGGISIWQLLIIVVIVVLLFGTKKLSSLGSDLGASIKGFKKAMNDDDEGKDDKTKSAPDADFTTKNLSEKTDETTKDEQKKSDKEQV